MARPRRITDEQIVAATVAAVVEHGAQVSLDVVAQRLGVTAPALIKRYGSRQALLVAALRPDPREMEALLAVPVDDRPFAAQLVDVLDRLSGYFARMLPRIMALRECGVEPRQLIDQAKGPMPLVAIAGISRWLGALAARGTIELTARETAATALVGAVSTRMMNAYLARRRWSRRAHLVYLRELAELFARALAVAPAAPRTRRPPTPEAAPARPAAAPRARPAPRSRRSAATRSSVRKRTHSS